MQGFVSSQSPVMKVNQNAPRSDEAANESIFTAPAPMAEQRQSGAVEGGLEL